VGLTRARLTQWRDRAGFSPNFQVLREPLHCIVTRPSCQRLGLADPVSGLVGASSITEVKNDPTIGGRINALRWYPTLRGVLTLRGGGIPRCVGCSRCTWDACQAQREGSRYGTLPQRRDK
jgi:hypothetical protein